jgi:hypothetical protein
MEVDVLTAKSLHTQERMARSAGNIECLDQTTTHYG